MIENYSIMESDDSCSGVVRYVGSLSASKEVFASDSVEQNTLIAEESSSNGGLVKVKPDTIHKILQVEAIELTFLSLMMDSEAMAVSLDESHLSIASTGPMQGNMCPR